MATQGNFVNDDITAVNITADFFFGDGSNLTNLPIPSVVTEACKAFMSADSTVNSNATFTQKNIFPATGALALNVGGFSSTTSGIDVPSSGIYIIMANMVYNSTAARVNPEFRFSINGTGQTERSRGAYIRATGGHNLSSSSLTTIYNLVAGDEIGLQFQIAGNTGGTNLETSSHVAIYRIG